MPHACSGGACTAFANVNVPCDDNNACTTNDTCDAAGQCLGSLDGAGSCNDGDACNGVETCSAGVCIPGTPIAVDDSNLKTLDACDPATGEVLHTDCSAQLDLTVFTTLAALAQCLYAGPAPIQVGIDGQPFPVDLEPLSEEAPFPPQRIAVLRGKVTNLDETLLAGVTIQVMGQPESGRTFTRDDGQFDMAVHGGGLLTVSYTKAGYLTVQRQVQTEWLHVATLPDVAMIPFDSHATVINLGAAATQLARGRVVDDVDGRRQATMLVQPGTSAALRLPDGATAPLTTLTVRATEYTEGDRGPEAMPAVLPPAIAYTYCLELSADEAVAAGATAVEFDQPVVFYVENFLGFPVGDIVPAGSYDRVKGTWVPEANGRVVKVLSITNGLADLDVTGDGLADSLDTDERARLGGLYAPGTTLWRVEMSHFTPWDLNWPYGPPEDACKPGDAVCDLGDGPESSQTEDDTCKQGGSIIECQNQTLGERIPITGTPYSLNYRSDRVPGRKDGSTLTIPLRGTHLPASVKQIEVEVEVAGQRLAQSYPCPSSPECAPNQRLTMTWGGKDGHGRRVQGLQTATVRVGYTYEAVYRQPAELAASFGAFGTAVTGVKARQELTIWNTWQRSLGTMTLVDQGLGGWSLSEHHTYDLTGKLLLGDGSQNKISGIGRLLRTQVSGASGYRTPRGLALTPDGTIYWTDIGSDSVHALSPDGNVRTIAGAVGSGYNGDDRPAVGAMLNEAAPRRGWCSLPASRA
jgi:hypothetical protein